MKVFIVTEADYDYHEIVGVYKKESDAEKVAARGNAVYPGLWYSVTEHKVE